MRAEISEQRAGDSSLTVMMSPSGDDVDRAAVRAEYFAKTTRNDFPNQRRISSEYSFVKVLKNAARIPRGDDIP
jgi:hypothetical protein